MRRTKRAALASTLLGLAAMTNGAQAADISGVWASNLAVCDKIFERKGGAVRFSPSSDIYGSGFIIAGRRIIGKTATCNIISERTDGLTITLAASCSDDITVSGMSFSVKVNDRDSITRSYPSLPELETTYYRCPAP